MNKTPSKSLVLLTPISAIVLLFVSAFIPNTIETNYSDIMGCEQSCTVDAAGYPLPFIVDYPGLSPAGSADLLGALLGNDNVNPITLIFSFLFWSAISFFIIRILCRKETRN